MRVLVFSESPLLRTPHGYYALDPWARFVERLAGSAQVSLLSPVTDLAPGAEVPAEMWRLDTAKLNVIPHDAYSSFAGYLKMWVRKARYWRVHLRDVFAKHDVIALRLPSPSLSISMAAADAARRPVVLFVAGDVFSQSDRIQSSRGLKRMIYSAIITMLVRQERRAGRRAARVFAYSSELALRHRGANVRHMRTPHLSERSFGVRTDTCQSRPVRLLRVSWLIPSKGIEDLLHAVRLLGMQGYDVTLEVVGKPRMAQYGEQLRALVTSLSLEGRVSWRGWVAFDKLEAIYDASDIQVISSLAEGTPRCIVEGLSRGLPLVCTAVGGSRDVLTDGVDALLVPPSAPEAMACAIARVITDGSLRRHLIQNGYGSARLATFEAMAPALLGELDAVVAAAS